MNEEQRIAFKKLIEEAEVVFLALQQDDLPKGDYPHLERAIERALETFKQKLPVKIDIAGQMYASEPCRVCGRLLEPQDLIEAVFTGYSADNLSRAAHGTCWAENIPQSDWAFPLDGIKNQTEVAASNRDSKDYNG